MNRSIKKKLDHLYNQYNDKKYICCDPIKYPALFNSRREIELVGLITSSLSFGKVSQIFKAMDEVMEITKGSPLDYTLNLKKNYFKNFRYRFVTGKDMHDFLRICNNILKTHYSIGDYFRKLYNKNSNLECSISTFLDNYKNINYLIPNSLKTSACKRIFMYLRWMVRKDNIDFGLWDFIPKKNLIIPLDTHISKKSLELGLTNRKTPSLVTAKEITQSLKTFSKEDPVKYDWALSHIGIIQNNFKGLL